MIEELETLLNNQDLSNLKEKVETFETGLYGRIDSLDKEMTQRETEIVQKIDHVEEINSEIDILDKNLRNHAGDIGFCRPVALDF